MIEKIGHYSLTNPASVYNEEAMTALELAGRTAAKVNECVGAFNDHKTETDNHLAEQDKAIPVKVESAVQKYIKNGAFDEAINEYAGDLEDRLENLIENVPEGSTTMDAEVVDIRLDADGKTHGSAGEAVRAQVLSLKDGVSKPNLINKDTLTPGYINTTGEVFNSHQKTTFQKWEYTSDLIPVTSGLPYTFSYKHDHEVALWYAISTYDANGNFISRPYVYDATTADYERTFTFPESVSFVRVSYRSYMTGEAKFEQSAYATQIPTKKPSNNLIDDYPLQFDGYIVDNGSIYPQTGEGYVGDGEPAMLEKYTRFIPVKAGKLYHLYTDAGAYPWVAIGVYSADGNAVTRYTSTNTGKYTFMIPTNGVAIMICTRTQNLYDLALFKSSKPMCAEQKAFENYVQLCEPVITNDYDKTVKSVNHRGYKGNLDQYGENTLSAFKASARHGFKYVECDVRATSDGVPVLLHDATVDRTSDGTGDISSMTFEEARALNFGTGYASDQIPSFEEFIGLCKSLGLHAYVEIKHTAEPFVKKLVGIVRMYGMREHVSFISFDMTALQYVRKHDAKARLGYVTESVTANTVASVLALGGDVFIDAGYSTVTDDVVTLCVENELPLEVWTVNGETSIVGMNPYISGVTSDTLIAGQVLQNSRISGAMTGAPAVLPVGEQTASVAEYEGEVV